MNEQQIAALFDRAESRAVTSRVMWVIAGIVVLLLAGAVVFHEGRVTERAALHAHALNDSLKHNADALRVSAKSIDSTARIAAAVTDTARKVRAVADSLRHRIRVVAPDSLAIDAGPTISVPPLVVALIGATDQLRRIDTLVIHADVAEIAGWQRRDSLHVVREQELEHKNTLVYDEGEHHGEHVGEAKAAIVLGILAIAVKKLFF